ncbi:hypothetical protein L211DRAFT_832916 [Terfezia boudieri ATCC MYA-4762]|uniref:Uncharacterized protein n=1 Tax=Terfezia boudieri ATCC MYA-4762 TaxID=1051890 RepID=A0A3N4MLP4_9PEZI|nr:hypothetical protein L211DRAFT_832916 [Terfezia boudieri ATCC MYA-4762]
MSGTMNSSSASPSIPTSTFPRVWHSIATARIHIETLMAGWAIPEFLTYIRGHPTISNEVLELARETTVNPDTELRETDTPPDSDVSFEAADPDDAGDDGEHTAGDRLHLKAFFMFGFVQEWVSPHIHWIWWRQCAVKRENLKRRVQEQEEKIYEQERLIEELERKLREEEDLEEETYREGFLAGEREGRGEVYPEEGRLLRATLEEEGRSGWEKGREDGLTIGRKQGRREMFEVMNHSDNPPSGKKSRQEETEARGEDSRYYTMREMVFWG